MVLVFEGALAYGFESWSDAAGNFESIDIADGLYAAFTTDGERLRLYPTEGVYGGLEKTGVYDLPALLSSIKGCSNCPEELRTDPSGLARFLDQD